MGPGLCGALRNRDAGHSLDGVRPGLRPGLANTSSKLLEKKTTQSRAGRPGRVAAPWPRVSAVWGVCGASLLPSGLEGHAMRRTVLGMLGLLAGIGVASVATPATAQAQNAILR